MRRSGLILLLGLVGGLFVSALAAQRPATRPGPKVFGSPKEFVYKKTPQGELKIFVYYPKGWKETDSRPGIVFFFGGGWRGGSPRQFALQAGYLAGRGMVAASAEYRVKSRHGVWPDKCVEDAKSAIRWFRANAKKLGVDPNRVVAAGGSAGGHLAACTAMVKALDPEGEDLSVSCKPNALVLFNPALNFFAGARGRDIMAMINNDEELARQISPTLHLTKDAPPALLLYGTQGMLLAHGQEFMAKAKRIGHKSELYLAQGQRHGFFNRSPWLERTTRRMDEFLISLGYLKGKPTVKEGQFKDIRPPRRARRARGRTRPHTRPAVPLGCTPRSGPADPGNSSTSRWVIPSCPDVLSDAQPMT